MATHRSPKGKRLAAEPSKGIRVATQKAKVKDKSLTRANVKERARLRADEPLAEATEALKAAQAKVKHRRQTRIRAEEALAQADDAMAAAQVEARQVRQAQVRRISFVVRLTVDERGQFRRTEIEHVESGGKQNLLSLDGESLVAFMKTSISPEVVPEHIIPAAPPAETEGAPTAGLCRPKSGPVVSDDRVVIKEKEKADDMETPKSGLVVSNVRVLRPGGQNLAALTLAPGEPFVVQARFQLQGSDAHSLAAKESSYEMKVYANEVTTGKGELLATYHAHLVQDVMEYTAVAVVPGNPPGLYRLFTHVTLGAPIRVIGHYEGPIIQVI